MNEVPQSITRDQLNEAIRTCGGSQYVIDACAGKTKIVVGGYYLPRDHDVCCPIQYAFKAGVPREQRGQFRVGEFDALLGYRGDPAEIQVIEVTE